MMLVVDQIDAKRAYPVERRENLSGRLQYREWECGGRRRERQNEEQEEIGR